MITVTNKDLFQHSAGVRYYGGLSLTVLVTCKSHI